MATLTICDANVTGKRIVFLCDRLGVINGAVTEASLPLKNFFVPIETYNTVNIVLQKASIKELNFQNLGIVDTARFVFIYPEYNSAQLQSDRLIFWSNEPVLVEGTQGPQSTALEYTWNPIGNLHVASGNGDYLLNSIWLKNDNTVYDVTLNILIGY